MNTSLLPVIDVAPLYDECGDKTKTASQIGDACRGPGFFYIRGHRVSEGLQTRLEKLSREFFAKPLETKMSIRMARGGRAWRGYFPVGDELTSGLPDQKEGIYFGSELSATHPKVRAGVPFHGPNLFPKVDGFREATLEYLDRLTELGHRLMEGVAISLGLQPAYFSEHLTADPTILFRIFHYPSLAAHRASQEEWSVGEHTDYGLLTILRQDHHAGLQIKSQGRWLDAPPIPDTFVCNIGDMLDRMTGGIYRSTPHRVRNADGEGRISFAFFFDPGYDAEIQPVLQDSRSQPSTSDRWDGVQLETLTGTYGKYLLDKVSKVFPELREEQLPDP